MYALFDADSSTSIAIKPAIVRDMAALARNAMLVEVYTTPKPGLVDRANNGAHQDMTVETFERSTDAIAPWLARFTDIGIQSAHQPVDRLLAALRPLGRQCEQAMFLATAGINTHKGMLFSLSLLCAAAGRLWQQGKILNQQTLCEVVAQATEGLVARELAANRHPRTAGERFFHQYGLSGVRGEVESGFQTVRKYALPVYRQALDEGADRNSALLEVMLALLEHNNDTNLVARGGLAGLDYVQQYARQIRQDTAFLSTARLQALQTMDQQLIQRNLSPGGSADLLAITWLLQQLER
ncbi:triphosphoribosyl-dephospho-CoA synthase CitG [Tolumonas lignilytica]|uniref:triphosphoribosyl-dephospho-CoA synthase CitG n=1 Tax=Tolumonas lignilytica TaxID=1283284 RepID=UPI0004659CAD|nr:triphosphoribosyl-dephospho-CoA synthase CitG [Tolumonas lignilytica]